MRSSCAARGSGSSACPSRPMSATRSPLIFVSDRPEHRAAPFSLVDKPTHRGPRLRNLPAHDRPNNRGAGRRPLAGAPSARHNKDDAERGVRRASGPLDPERVRRVLLHQPEHEAAVLVAPGVDVEPEVGLDQLDVARLVLRSGAGRPDRSDWVGDDRRGRSLVALVRCRACHVEVLWRRLARSFWSSPAWRAAPRGCGWPTASLARPGRGAPRRPRRPCRPCP